MELLKPGTQLPAGEIEAKGVPEGTPILIEQPTGELPHGYGYRGRLGHHPVLVTVIEPAALADPDIKDSLMRGVARAAQRDHGNMVKTLGLVEDETYGLYVVRLDPQCPTVRQVIHQHMAQGKRIPVPLACTLGANVCDALSTLHPTVLHLYVSPDTVHVTPDGRALLSATGEGALVTASPGFERFRKAGLLPHAAPELLESPPVPVLETDVFGVGTLVIEMLAGRTVESAGVLVTELGVIGPPHLLQILQQSIEPDPSARPANILALRSELLQAGLPDAAMPPPPPPPVPQGPTPPPPISMPGGIGPGAGASWGAPGAMGPPPLPGPQGGPPPPPPPSAKAGSGPKRSPPPPPKPAARSPRPPAQAAGSGGAGGDDWSALDRATRKLLDDSGSSMAEMTRPVDGTERASDLGLSIAAFDDAATRLETIDGESGLLGVAQAVDAYGKEDKEKSAELRLEQLRREALPDGSYFGTFAEGDDTGARPLEYKSGLIDLGGPRAEFVRNEDPSATNYLVTRDGVDHGPYSIKDLTAMIRKGELHNADTLTLRHDDSQMLAVDHPKLREVFELRARAQDKHTKTNPTDVPVPKGVRREIVSTSAKSSRGAGTVIWVLIALAVFAAAGWVLWQRSGGG